MKKLLLLLLITVAAVSAQASNVLEGKVYSIELMDVYVQAPDSTAVRIPGDVATFIVDGKPTDYCDLQLNQQVTVQYKPGFNTASVYPPEYHVTGTENYKRDSVIDGQVVHHLWSNGKWKRVP